MRWMLGMFGAIAILETITLLGACSSSPETQATTSTTSSTTGSMESSTSGAGGGANGGYGKSLCGACVLKACAGEQAACEAEPSCSAHLECLLKCPVGADGDADPACEQACPVVSGTAAQSAGDALAFCRTAGQGASCAVTCGHASADGGEPETCKGNPILTQQCKPSQLSDPCYKCQFEKCCDSVDACFNGGPATDLTNCWLACTTDDIACELACFDQYPDGVVGFGGYSACTEVNCFAPGGACQHAQPASCLDCESTQCCEELAACDTDAECFLITQCTLGCKSQDTLCGGACFAAHPKGQAALGKLAVCDGQRCAGKCEP